MFNQLFGSILRKLGPSRKGNQRAAKPARCRLQVEMLEDRLVPASVQPLLLHPLPGAVHTAATPSSFGYTPLQIRTAYGISNISFGSTGGDGKGQTIAIIDMFNDPNIVSDLDTFDKAFSLGASGPSLYTLYGSASTFLTVFNERGQVINPRNTSVPVEPNPATNPAGDSAIEISLDVEWAHAIAPGAKIDLIEANSSSNADLYPAAHMAAGLPGVSVVSMSFGASESSGETSLDSYFTTPTGHQGVTFLASTGDGSVGEYPAFSPNVVAVGGTTLSLNANNTIQSETAWSTGSNGGSSGTGGGTSLVVKEPAYQLGVQNTGFRTAPDVAFDANPSSGVPVYDSYDTAGWNQIGGTSFSAPAWAGLVAIANQGRSLLGKTTLNSSTSAQQTLNALYALPSSDFHDITSGSISANGHTYFAGTGYDEVTGRGTPLANLLVPDLAAYGTASQLIVATQPSSSVAAGNPFSLVIKAADAFGNVDTSFTGSVTISLAANPGSSTLGGTLTVKAVNGVATFTNLTLNNAGSGYTLQITGTGLASAKTSAITVTGKTTPTPTPTPTPSYNGVNFALLSNGQLLEFSAAGQMLVASGIGYISNQSTDSQGKAVLDMVTTSGLAYEFHDGSGLVYLYSGVKSAVADQGVSYVLFTSGYLNEYDDATGQWTYIDNGVSAISAGTDQQGDNAVDVIFSSGNAYEYSDNTGWYFIASGVYSISGGQQGQATFVTTSGNAYLFSEAMGSSTFLAANIVQVTIGTDQNGNAIIDLLAANGNLQQYQAGSGWTSLASGVQSISKAHAGVVDVVFSDGNASEYNPDGTWVALTSGAVVAV